MINYNQKMQLFRKGAALLLVCGLVGLLAACSPSRSFESVSLLSSLAGGSYPDQYSRIAVRYQGQTGLQEGDLYRPTEGDPQAAMMILPGASPNGRDDPRVVAFAAQWAEAGFLVLVPDIANLRRLQVSASDSLVMADSLRYLAGEAGPNIPLGAFGLSYAVGPLMIALLQPDLAERVDFVVALGGYYSSQAVSTYVTTGAYRAPGQERWRRREPDGFGAWLFAYSNAARLEDPDDAWRLRRIAELRLDDRQSDIETLRHGLGPEGQSVLAFLENRDPDAVPELEQALPARIKAEMRALDLTTYSLKGAGPRLFLVHGKEDQVIPYTESMALAEAVNAEGEEERAELYLLDAFRHTDLGRTTLGDVITLSSVLYEILEIRDFAPSAPDVSCGQSCPDSSTRPDPAPA